MNSRALLLLIPGRRGLGRAGRNSAFFVLYFFIPLAFAQPSQRVLNGGFEQGLKGWRATGSVHLETNRPLDGRISAVIGPGVGSLIQRIETGSGNDFTLYAALQ